MYFQPALTYCLPAVIRREPTRKIRTVGAMLAIRDLNASLSLFIIICLVSMLFKGLSCGQCRDQTTQSQRGTYQWQEQEGVTKGKQA